MGKESKPIEQIEHQFEDLQKAQEGRPPQVVLFEATKEEKPRRGYPKAAIEVICGSPVSLPTIRDIKDKTQYLSLIAALDSEIVNRYRYMPVLRPVLRENRSEDSQLIVLGYNNSVYIPYDQQELLRQTVDILLPVLEEKRREHLMKKAEASRKKGTSKDKGKLHPDNVASLVEKVTGKYKEGEQIYYRRDTEFQELIDLSHQTINMVIRLALRDGVISPLPMTGRSVSRSREEMILVFNHGAKLWNEGKEIFREGRQARRERKFPNNLTLKQTAERLDVPTAVFVSWIKEGKISLDSNLKETMKRIGNPRRNKQKLIDPELLESEEVKNLVAEREKERREFIWTNLNGSRFHNNRGWLATVSQVAQEAGYNIRTRSIPALSEALKERGIDIKDVPSSKGYYRVLIKEDLPQAVEVAREIIESDSRFTRYR